MDSGESFSSVLFRVTLAEYGTRDNQLGTPYNRIEAFWSYVLLQVEVFRET